MYTTRKVGNEPRRSVAQQTLNSADGAFRANFAALRVSVLLTHRAKRVQIHFDDDDQIERWVWLESIDGQLLR